MKLRPYLESPVRFVLLLLASAALGGCETIASRLEAPDVRIESLALRSATVDAQRFRVALAVSNPNPIPIPIDRLDFSVRLGGGGLMSGQSIEAFTLGPGATRTVQLDVDSDLVSSLTRLLALVQGPGDSISYDLDGSVTLGRGLRRNLPFSFRGQVPLSVPGSASE